MSRQKREERSYRRKACENKRLEHPLLGIFKNFFESCKLVQKLLRSSQNVDGIVDAYTENNGSHKDRKRIELSVEKSRKRKRRDACVKHRARHENRAFDAPEEEHRKEYDKDKAYAKGENGIVRHFIDFLEAFVSSFDRETRRNRIFFVAKVSNQGIRTSENMRHENIVGRRANKLRVHHAVI